MLVGQEPEMAELLAAARSAREGRGSLVWVRGEAGIGKTRLVGELVDRARAEGLAVAVGSCREGAAAAYWPWVQVVQTLFAGEVPADLAPLRAPAAVRDLAQLVTSPGQPIHVADLVGGALDRGDAGDAADGQAIAAYRRRLIDLERRGVEVGLPGPGLVAGGERGLSQAEEELGRRLRFVALCEQGAWAEVGPPASPRAARANRAVSPARRATSAAWASARPDPTGDPVAPPRTRTRTPWQGG